jgi:hypothetical protein
MRKEVVTLRERIKRLGLSYRAAAPRLGLSLSGLHHNLRNETPIGRQTEIILDMLEREAGIPPAPPQRARRAVTMSAALILALAAPPARAADVPNKPVTFLFSEDDQISGTYDQLRDSIKPKSLIPDDKSLNAPLTRLDYVLINIKNNLEQNISAPVNHNTHEYFNMTQGEEYISGEATFGVAYYEAKGRLFLSERNFFRLP